jgi:hypothetical protein
MAKARSTTTLLWAGLGIAALAGAASKIVEFSHPGTASTHFISHAYEPLYLLANAIGLIYCRKICGDHHGRSTMRTAWLLMAGSCAAAIVRHGFEWTTFLLGWDDGNMATNIVSLRQIPTVLAMVFLTASLIFMWSSFAAVGLGMRYRLRDAVMLLAVLALMVGVLSNRQELWDDRSEYVLMRYLQWSSPVILALPALIGLALQPVCKEMGGGQLAVSLRYLVWSLLLRLASLLATFTPALKGVSVVAMAGTAAFWAAPWLFALAILSRWRMTESLHELSELYERNPEAELAKLTGAGNLS